MISKRAAILAVAVMVAALVPVSVSGQAKQTKQEKDAADAAAAYERAMVFFQQGAYKEAEKEFRTAEKKTDDKNLDYVMAAAYNYLKLHRPDDAKKRYERIYKKDPTNARALVGMAASYEEMQDYREAVRMWQRYVKMDLPAAEAREAQALLRTAQDLFVARYEIAENPAGGAANMATPQQELEWGLGIAKDIASTGVPVVQDEVVTKYVEDLCRTLVKNARNYPTNYELFVLDSAAVNAMTTPGFIFVFRGVLEASDTEAALAGVLAHEIGHAVAHHVAKMQTKIAQDQQQLAKYKQSNSRWSRFMASLMESGNPYGQLKFSRDNEAQADRIGVHVAYDAGFDPRGITQIFQKFESLSPSSRSAYDLMMQTHPFSFDRVNVVNEYVSLLPEKSLRTTSPAFERMKARLKALPPPEDATGQMKPALGPSKTAPPSPPPSSRGGGRSGGGTSRGGDTRSSGAVRSFSLDNAPFAGEMPADWTMRETEAGTIVFEGEEGTEAYQVTVELQVGPKSQFRGLTIDDMAGRVSQTLSKRARAQVEEPEPDTNPEGRPARKIVATYNMTDSRGRQVPVRHASSLMDYPGWFVVISYFAPESIYDKYSRQGATIIDGFHYTGR